MATLLLAATLAGSVALVQAANPTSYAITGYVYENNSVPVPSGVTVQLLSGASHQVFNTTTGAHGKFTFTYSGTSNTLVPGSWGLWVPPQGNVSLGGTACSPCGVLPAHPAPLYNYYTAQNLTSTTQTHSIRGVSLLTYNATLSGNVSKGTSKAPGANVELIAPGYSGFVLTNNTTQSIGNYTMKVPWGTWTLETVLPGVPTATYDFRQVTVAAPKVSLNLTMSKFLTYGTIYQASDPTSPVPHGGNATVFDTGTGDLYANELTDGGFYNVGTYPAGFTGPGARRSTSCSRRSATRRSGTP